MDEQIRKLFKKPFETTEKRDKLYDYRDKQKPRDPEEIEMEKLLEQQFDDE